jgi:integrase
VKIIDDATVNATVAHLPIVVADMVRLQRLTGCRPGEVCSMRPCDIDRSGEIWVHRPESHKTEHHGHTRTIYIGPQAQEVLLPYLLRDTSSNCFSPAESERKRLLKMREARRTRVQPSQQNRRKAKPKRRARECYHKDAYRTAIARACEKAGVPHWSPNRLRHTAATEIRKRFGLEAAQIILGHSRADVTQIYAERDQARGLEVVKAIG